MNLRLESALLVSFLAAACGSPSPPQPEVRFLDVTVAGTGTGTVTSSPAGIDCGNACGFSFALGTMVTLTATPGAGGTFDGWAGDCTGTAACTVTMDAAHSVAATFGQGTPTVAFADPTAGETVKAGVAFTATLDVANFILEAPGAANAAGHGHYHIFLDDTASMYLIQGFTPTTPDITLDAATSRGTHTLIASLRNNDHSALGVEGMVGVFVVEAGDPTITVSCTDPAVCAAGVAAGGTVDVDVAATGVRFVAPGSTSPYEGHYHVWLDSTAGPFEADFNPTHTVSIPAGTAAGAHTVIVSLRLGNHMAWTPATESMVTVTVN